MLENEKPGNDYALCTDRNPYNRSTYEFKRQKKVQLKQPEFCLGHILYFLNSFYMIFQLSCKNKVKAKKSYLFNQNKSDKYSMF